MPPAKRARRSNRSSLNELQAPSEDEFVDVKSEDDNPSVSGGPSLSSRSRVESLRERIQLFYGATNEELIRALEIRGKWGNKLFSVDEKDLRFTESNVPPPSLHDQAVSTLIRISGNDEAVDFKGFECIVNDTRLDPHESQLCDNICSFLNVGYSVVSMDWSSHELLALSVRVTETEPINASAIFSLADSPTLIYIYSVQGAKATLRGSIQGNYGIAKEIKWRHGGSEIAAVFGNGQVGIFNVSADFDGVHELNLKPLASISDAGASCICWRTEIDLVVGYENGYLANFGAQKTITPNFVTRPHSTVITALASGWPDYPETLFTTSVDGRSCVYKTVNDLRLVYKAPRLKFFAPCACYSPMSDSFVSLETVDTTKLVPWRKPDLVQAQTTLTRHDSGVFSVAASHSHPLLISGGQDGELHIANPLRRTMVTRRNRDVHMDCTVWRLECSHKSSAYRFIECLRPSSLPKRKLPSALPLHPSTINIASVGWKPNSTWYAAGTAAGIVRFENISR